MSKKIESTVESLIKEDVESLGLEIEYVEYAKEGGTNILRIVVDKKDEKVDIDDCEKLSRLIDDKIDKKIDIKGEYTLEVSSPGIERAIKRDSLYQKYIDEPIRFSLYKQVNGKKIIIGKIISLEEERMIVNSENEEYTIEKTNIASANTYFDFGDNK